MSRNNDEWWKSLTRGEKLFLRSLMRMIQGAKRSQVVEVARAARKWESGRGCFIKVRLMHRRKASNFKPPEQASNFKPQASGKFQAPSFKTSAC